MSQWFRKVITKAADEQHDEWLRKRRMPGKPSEFIDLLLEHGPMNVTNFVTLARCSKQTAYNTLSKLSQAGIIQNNGGKYSLKEQ